MMGFATRSQKWSRVTPGVAVATETGSFALPGWAYFFLILGSRIAQLDGQGCRFVAGVAVPTRSFAASLATTGVVTARSVAKLDRTDTQQYFAWLCSLPVGTSLLYLAGSDTLKAVIKGHEEREGQKYLCVSVSGGKARGTYLLPEAVSWKLRGASSSLGSTRSVSDNAARQTDFVTGLARHLISGGDRFEFFTYSRVECVIIGRRGLLEPEIADTTFVVELQDGRKASGRLQDVLGVREFLGRRDSFRSALLSPSARAGEALSSVGTSAPVAVFDGALGFLKWRDYWRSSSWIVILDRTELRFAEAVAVLNNEYIQYRTDDGTIKGVPTQPSGAELLVYREDRR